MIELRPYQTEAIDAIYSYFMGADGNPLIVLPTGTGKSIVIAEFLRGALGRWPETRAVMVTHVKELIQQNHAALVRDWPEAPAGIYSAGLGQKDLSGSITCAGIQSIYKRAYEIQNCDLLIVDECHLIPRNADTMYGRFIKELREINPKLKVIGFTATPFRLDSGELHRGDDALFTDIAYEMSILDAVEQGYLSEVLPKAMSTTLDVSSVGTRGGEFIASDLEAAIDQDDVNGPAVKEIIEYGHDRGSWLVYCAGVKHAEHVAETIRAAGYSAGWVTGDTPATERACILNNFKAGNLRAVVNVNVLTTGFDAPGVDLIAMLRPTKSPGLFIQMVGRGTRLASGKEDCLLLDFAGNTARHGPIDMIKGKKEKGDEDGVAPTKECPKCAAICFAGCRTCPQCDFKFPEPKPEIAQAAATDAVLSTQLKAVWENISDVQYFLHEKIGKPPSMRVSYRCGLTFFNEWVCLEHTGYAHQKAVRWWRTRKPGEKTPPSISAALNDAADLPQPRRILVRPAGKYREVISYEF